MGPTRRVSFRDAPVDNFAEASNTAMTRVVVLVALYTACIGI